MRRAGVALAASALLLTGCAADVRGELRRDVADITDDANARDAAGVRAGVDDLLERLDGAVASGELSSAEAARIAELARQLADLADALEPDAVEEPTEAPSPAPEPPAEPTEEPDEDEDEEEPEEPSEPSEPAPTSEPTEPSSPTPTPAETLLPDVVPTG